MRYESHTLKDFIFKQKSIFFIYFDYSMIGIRTNPNYTMILNERFQEMIDQGFAFFY